MRNILFVLLTCLAIQAEGNPAYIGCGLISTYSGHANLQTTTTIMGQTVATSSSILSASAATYISGGTVTITLNGMQLGGIYATSGTLSTSDSTLVNYDCTADGAGSLFRRISSGSASVSFTWTAANEASTTIWVLSAPGYGVVNRQAVTLTNSNPGSPTPAPTLTTPTPAPTPAPTSAGCTSDNPAYSKMTTLSSGLKLYWNLGSSTVDFYIIHEGSDGWLSLAAASSNMMVGGDAIVAQGLTSGTTTSVSRYDLSGKTTSGVQISSSKGLVHTGAGITQGFTYLRFQRSLAATGNDVSISSTDSTWFLWAYGSSSSISYHGSNRGAVSLNLATCDQAGAVYNYDKFQQHGWLMGIGWGVVVPLGALFATATRGANPLVAVPAWPMVHMAIQISGAILFTVGIAMAIAAVDEAKSAHFKDTHGKLGLVLVVVGWLQISLAIVRPANDPTNEPHLHKVWSGMHRLVGVTLLVAAFANIFMGMDEGVARDYLNVDSAPKVTFGVWVGIICLAFLVLGYMSFMKSRVDPSNTSGLSESHSELDIKTPIADGDENETVVEL